MKRQEIQKLIKEMVKEIAGGPGIAPRPTEKPTTTPTRPTQPPSPKIPNPLQPTRPDIRPKPKASLSHGVKLFLKARQGLKEAIDTTNYPDFINPEARASIEDETDYVESILPDLGPNADKYLEIITSEAYKKAVDRLATYTGVKVSELEARYPDIGSMMSIIMSCDKAISNFERGNEKKIEQLAVSTVLTMDEYKYIKIMVDRGEIKLDVKLAPHADLQNIVASDEMDKMMGNELTVGENLEAQVYSAMMGDTEGKLRRALANHMMQGDALNKFFLFHLAEEELKKFNPTLPSKYGLLFATSMVLNYRMPKAPFTRDFIDSNGTGSEEVIPSENEDGTYTIKVRGRNFPLLVHELVKGIGEYLTMDVASQEELDTDVASDEYKQFMTGPGLTNRLRQLIPTDKVKYIPIIQRLFFKLPISQIKEVLYGGGKAQSIMKGLIKQAEEQSKHFEPKQQEEPEWTDSQNPDQPEY